MVHPGTNGLATAHPLTLNMIKLAEHYKRFSRTRNIAKSNQAPSRKPTAWKSNQICSKAMRRCHRTDQGCHRPGQASAGRGVPRSNGECHNPSPGDHPPPAPAIACQHQPPLIEADYPVEPKRTTGLRHRAQAYIVNTRHDSKTKTAPSRPTEVRNSLCA